ncbi:hypothetical protein [Anaerorhabdus sp.]|uniref:hypothetical protein n=1 Tax=Anaerorhabdus sp. TaxID=1872524 RepID=UPI002B20F993|nr:hypothetical protein [Anaerorhabdus sp.]MEA4875300.1 hypothetical protein [Anaerorhabdus sp.]
MPTKNKNERLSQLEKEGERIAKHAAKKGFTVTDVETITYFAKKYAKESAVVGSCEVTKNG